MIHLIIEMQLHSGFLEGFLKSWGVILASEIGDKTFFIAAIMAMRNPRKQVHISDRFFSTTALSQTSASLFELLSNFPNLYRFELLLVSI